MHTDFFSARIGCQLEHPLYGIDLAALCVRESAREHDCFGHLGIVML